LLNTTLHSSFLLGRAAPSLLRPRLYRIFDFCGAGSPGFAEANAGPVSVGELNACSLKRGADSPHCFSSSA
jgi:hypothetical protein